jgi:hypothetical protein
MKIRITATAKMVQVYRMAIELTGSVQLEVCLLILQECSTTVLLLMVVQQ